MDGRISQLIEDRPIAKPELPLPALFTPSKMSELPTRQQSRSRDAAMERAHFYKKRTSRSGSPIYSFYITRDTPDV
jgi:hypothetical protein